MAASERAGARENDRLGAYKAKRDFTRTPEPQGNLRKSARKLRYLIQKHDATRLHYDFRLEWNGALMSWAVPKGPSENPDDKRLAVHVEDHPVAYGDFEGTIPEGEYGGGTVMLWDRGSWTPHGDVEEGLRKGKLAFTLNGERLRGDWALVRLRARDRSGKDNWLLIKEKDDHVRRSGKPVTERETTSVKSGRSMEEIAGGVGRGARVWHSNKPGRAKASGDPVIVAPARRPSAKAKAKAKPAAAGQRVKKKPRVRAS